MLADQLQILLVEVLIFARARTFLLMSACATIFDFFIFIDNETFANLAERMALARSRGQPSPAATHRAKGIFVVLFLVVLLARVIVVLVGSCSVMNLALVVFVPLLVVFLVIQHRLTLDQVPEAHLG